jgi:hypothetical protein
MLHNLQEEQRALLCEPSSLSQSHILFGHFFSNTLVPVHMACLSGIYLEVSCLNCRAGFALKGNVMYDV